MLSADKPLNVVVNFFRSASTSAVTCCHFKSNQHLDAALAGNTDLDIFVPKDQKGRFHALIKSKPQFKEFRTIGSGKYENVEDYLGFDEETAKLTHLHVHYQLVIGEKFFKSYVVPWDKDFENACPSNQSGLTIPEPEVELVLLLSRLSLKLRYRDLVIPGLARRLFGKAERAEYQWLLDRIDRDKYTEVCLRFMRAKTASMLIALADSPPRLMDLFKLRRLVARDLKQYRVSAWYIVQLKRAMREAIWFTGAVNKRIINLPFAFRRTLPDQGLFIAFVGPDGAGKSTLVKNIRKWLTWKLDVHYVYFGSGDGPASFFRWPLTLTLKITKQLRRKKSASVQIGSANPKRITGERVGWAITLAVEKKYKFWKAKLAKKQGCVVIFDRFPQTDTLGFNDGPLLQDWKEQGGLKSAIANWEYNIYRNIQDVGPDLTFRLLVSPETAVSRKTDMQIDEIQRRIDAVKAIQFPNSKVVEISGDDPLETVIKTVRHHVWEHL